MPSPADSAAPSPSAAPAAPIALRRPAPFLFFLLILPYGTSFGFVSVAFAYLATHAAHPMTAQQALGIVAAAFLPHTFKPLWAPLVDETLTKKAWYLIALGLTAAGTVAVASIPLAPERGGVITAVILVSQLGLTLMGMCCEAFIGLGVPDEEKGRASGWYNAGSNFGVGVGGGVALWLAMHLPAAWMSGAVLGAVMLACALPLALFDEPRGAHALPGGAPADANGSAADSPAAHPGGVLRGLRELGANLKQIFTSRAGLLGMALCLSPISAGASANVFGTGADAWHVGEDTVALINGVLGGLITSAGSLAGGWLADRMPRQRLYILSGSSMALTAAVIALAPRTPLAYVTLTLLYSFFVGVSYTAFTSFVLELIGKGAVATKYNLFAAAMNGAIAYMTALLGRVETSRGVTAALFTDAGCTLGSVLLLGALIALVKPRPLAAGKNV